MLTTFIGVKSTAFMWEIEPVWKTLVFIRVIDNQATPTSWMMSDWYTNQYHETCQTDW